MAFMFFKGGMLKEAKILHICIEENYLITNYLVKELIDKAEPLSIREGR